MSAELLINVTPSESRVALIENGILQEIHVERHTKRGLVGNIYRGKVSRVLPGMQACLLYTSPSPRDQRGTRMPSSA